MTFAARGLEPRSPNVISPVSAERNFWVLGLEAAAVFEEQATAILNAYHRSLWSIRNPVSVIHNSGLHPQTAVAGGGNGLAAR
jgi:hypothetical protein